MNNLTQFSALPISLNFFSASIPHLSSGDDGNEDIVKLLGLQTQLIHNIGGKLDQIQNQLDVIFDTLEKIGSNIENLPEQVVAELYQKDIKAILILIKEKNKAFRIDFSKNPTQALETYRGVFREILPILQVARVKLFYLEELFTLPVICSCLYFELICMEVGQEPPTVFKVILNAYKDLINQCLAKKLTGELQNVLDDHRNNLEKLKTIFAYNFGFIDKTPGKKNILILVGAGDKMIEVATTFTNFAVNKYRSKLQPDPVLLNDPATQALLRRKLIEESDLPGLVAVDSIMEIEKISYDLTNPENISEIKPLYTANKIFNISLKELVDSLPQAEVTLDKIPAIYPLVKSDNGNIIAHFGGKFRPENEDFQELISKSGYELLKYAALTNIALTTVDNINQILSEETADSPLVFIQNQLDQTLELINPWVNELIKELDEKSNQLEFAAEREKLLEIRLKMAALKADAATIYFNFQQLEKETLETLAKEKYGAIIGLIQNIGREIEIGIQNIHREGEKFGKDIGKNLEKSVQDIGEAIEVAVNFVGDQTKGYLETLSNAEKRIREGKLVDAIWHITTDNFNHTDDNLAKAVQNSSLLNSVASSVCAIYGGPAGAAAYAAWYTYKLTGDLQLALKTGIIAGLTSYTTKAINLTDGVPLQTDEVIKRSLATSAVGAIAIAAGGGDEKAIMEGFLKGAALSIASNIYKSYTKEEIEGRAPKNGPVLKYKMDLYKDKYLILRDSAGKDLFKSVYDDTFGEYHLVPNDGVQTMGLLQLGRDVSIVGIASSTEGGFQLFTETAIPMQLLADVPYMNDMAYFHDIWCDKMIDAGYPLNAFETAVTILPATILTVAGSPTPLLEKLNEVIIANSKEKEAPKED